MSHPRERFDLVADVGAEAAFLDAWNRDRLHHGWLLTGVEGVGKASFAYRAARRLLGAEPDAARGPLGAAPYDPVSRLVAGRAHPDLLVLERAEEGGRLRRTISVDQARALPEFFAKSPSQARFRVAIIDAADDLNLNAANALLKVLEEPPERGVLFLVCHAPGRLLATIRSRCRRLAFPRWPEVELAALVERRTGLDRDAADRIAALAAGSPGQALALASGPMLELDAVAERWVAEGLTLAEQVAAADSFRGGEGGGRFEALMERLSAAVRHRAIGSGPQAAARWSELWSRLEALREQALGLNLDKADALAAAAADLNRTRAAC
ncbi:DNA polymerase III subunit delta' [Brevundimonas sp.]|jgi:DNA polymerase-3 subunit delta'|uniref:DNA polymerase III subunit delta' n=1 Tax=Brevundimonas sp. TaxID=1871086 RepID=UPI00391DB0E5